MSTQFDELLEQALQLSADERMALSEALAASLPNLMDEPPFTDEEIQHLLAPDPRSPREIAALGLLGTWADQTIEDGAAWLNVRKRERKLRHAWLR